ncbi:hypothetical protein CJ030_MR6G016564 [Morella rubra]|uniref:Uncharacterized protein n=1 Tax=Morella rubra TaxID=262757 RepID=A0A6A1V9D4_9ROSI|nr:hypothetical protein CJ030_MR6G016564 [Morella rubra]
MENHLASISNSQRRGKTCGLALNKVRATQLGKLSVSIPDDCAADVGENSAKLSTQIGLLVRGTIPMAISSWNEVPPECKEYIKVRILDDFNLDYNREEDLQTENMIMAKELPSVQGWYEDVCSILKTVDIGFVELYAASHKRKNGDWLSDVAKDNHVLGPKPGYVRGLGRAMKPPRTSGSSSTNVARQLREAQLEIDRLKAEREAEVEQMRIERDAEMERMRAERQQEMKELEDRLMREMRERMNDFMANSSHGL